MLDHGESKGVKEKHLLLLHDYAKAFECVDHNQLWKILKKTGVTRPPYLSPEKCVYKSRSKLEHGTEQLTGSKL